MKQLREGVVFLEAVSCCVSLASKSFASVVHSDVCLFVFSVLVAGLLESCMAGFCSDDVASTFFLLLATAELREAFGKRCNRCFRWDLSCWHPMHLRVYPYTLTSVAPKIQSLLGNCSLGVGVAACTFEAVDLTSNCTLPNRAPCFKSHVGVLEVLKSVPHLVSSFGTLRLFRAPTVSESSLIPRKILSCHFDSIWVTTSTGQRSDRSTYRRGILKVSAM